VQNIQRFRIDGVLGEGGMGTVYRAYDPELERAVAIKVLNAPSTRIEMLDERRTVDLREDRPRTHDELLAEARVMAAISHPNVLPVFEVGRLGDKVFLVMELIEGIDLRQWLGNHTVSEIVEVLVAAARGLTAAHTRGIVHGDFKPDNVLIGEGRVCVADFGVSSFVKGSRASLMRIDDARGTPAYLAPEVWRGDPITSTTDVYAFATTAAEALLGELPSEDLTKLATALDKRGVPPYVRAAIVRGLARDPSARPVDLVAALSPPARKRLWLVPAIAGGALAIGATVVLVTRGSARPTCAPTSHADVWSDARAEELRAKKLPDDIIATLTDRFAEITALRTATCQDLEAGKVGTVEQGTITTCLDRLVIEYDERIRATLLQTDRAKYLLGTPPSAADCRTRRDSALDPMKQRALFRRFLAGMVGPRDQWRPEVTAMIPLALEAGDHELASRMGEALGAELAVQRDLAASRKAFEQARMYAQQAGSPMAELRVVTHHLKVERFHDELAIGRLLANDAKVLVERVPKTTPFIEQTFLEIATLAAKRGEHAEALEYNRRLLAILEASKRGDGTAALERRIQIIESVVKLDEPDPDFKKLVDDTHALNERLRDKLTPGAYSGAVFTLAEAYRLMNDRRGDTLWAQGVDLLRDQKAEPGTSPIHHRAMLAGQLYVRERQDEAIEIMREVVRDAARGDLADVAAANRRGTYTAGLALMLYTTNRLAEAHPVAEDALLEITGKVGPTHAETRKILDLLVSIELELGDLASAEKHVEAIARAIKATPTPELEADLLVTRASLARAQGAIETAEKLARQALATFTELKAKDSLVRGASFQLGRILAARGDDAGALPYMLAGLEPPTRGIYDCRNEFLIAIVEREAGKRKDGDDRARRCIAYVANIKGFAKRRAEMEAWLAAP
jgi:serine/threonine protein kinase/tetratricopeptide (TPR) repeat protein